MARNGDDDGSEREHRERLAFLGTRTAVVAHEINNPIAAAILALTSLEGRLATHPDALDAASVDLESIRGALEHVAVLVRGIGLYARPTRAGDTESLQLEEVARDAIRLCRLPDRFGYVEPKLASTPAPSVHGDRTRLAQVAVNLLVNAFEAVGEVGSAHVRVRTGPTPDGGAELVVEDDGPGVPEELRDRLFERFVGDGMGLGLWVASRIAADHGGRLMHERASEGLTRFRLQLPADETTPVQM